MTDDSFITYHALQVWFLDGSVTCYHKYHLPLALLSLLVLLLLLLVIPVVTVITFSDKVPQKV